MIHFFKHTGRAYDACQTREDIKDGDCLICDDGVVGLAWTWPVAVTANIGYLHGVKQDGTLDALIADAGWTADQVRYAITQAQDLKRPLDPEFAAWRARNPALDFGNMR